MPISTLSSSVKCNYCAMNKPLLLASRSALDLIWELLSLAAAPTLLLWAHSSAEVERFVKNADA